MAVESLSWYRDPVRKSIEVRCDPAHAFSVFTAGFSRWWPLATHSLSTDRAIACVIEARVGGGVYEVRDDGERIYWGRVLEWEPPVRFVMTWHPGGSPETAQQVEVRFSASGTGTRVDLEHRGWEALGEMADRARSEYDHGWGSVFVELFAAACAAEGKSRQ